LDTVQKDIATSHTYVRSFRLGYPRLGFHPHFTYFMAEFPIPNSIKPSSTCCSGNLGLCNLERELPRFCMLLWRLDFPHAKVLNIHVGCSVPPKCCDRSSPSYYLVRRSTAFCSCITPSSRVRTLVYLYPVIIVIFVKPYFHFSYSLTILNGIPYHGFEPNPFVFNWTHGLFMR
jgi:hypothetical protein